jgi:tRNA G10  N-methylase Trm11
MGAYLFWLGKKPLLSLAELIAVFGEKSIKTFESEMAILEVDENKFTEENAQKILNSLGGTMKIAKIYDVADVLSQTAELIEKAYDATHHKFSNLNKIIFAINAYGLEKGVGHSLMEFLKIYKKYLAELGYASRYLNKSERNIDTAFALDEDIVHRGVEYNIAKIEGKIFLSYTVAAQDFRLYANRDYGKPYRDAQAGMLPPKLAQVMINIGEGLANNEEKHTKARFARLLYDPFCGSGTILMESLLAETNCTGSDIRKETVEGAKINCRWIQEKFPHSSHASFETFVQDITAMNPDEIEKKYHPAVIVSESYLGPYFRKKPSQEEIKKLQKNLGELYGKAIEKLSKLHTPIVLAIASHKQNGDYFFNEEIIHAIKQANLKQATLLPNWILKRLTAQEATKMGYAPDRRTLLYDRDDQMVAREIFVLTPE